MADLTPETEALMLAYVYGELSEGAATAFEEQIAGDADLRAEVDGLLATRDLLDMDVRYGEESGLDEPPAHLREAIFRAEALARPADLRQAIVQRAAPADEAAPLLHRLSTWLLGGGLALGAAAAALVVVTSSGEMKAPEADLAAPASAERPEEAKRTASKKDRAQFADADKAAAPGAAPADEAPTYEIGEVFGDSPDDAESDGAKEDSKLAAAEPGAQGVAQRGVAAAPSRGGRDDLNAPATISAGEGASSGVGVKVVDDRLAKKPAARGRRLESEGRSRSAAKDVASADPSPAEAPRKSRRASRAKRAPSADDDALGGPPSLPPSVSRAKRERQRLAEKSTKKNKKSAKGADRQTMRDMRADLKTNETMQAADAQMKRGRYGEAADMYRSMLRGRPANKSQVIFARYIEACFRAKRDRAAVAAWRDLDRVMKGRPVEGDIRGAYIYAGQSAQRLGNEALAEQIFAKTR